VSVLAGQKKEDPERELMAREDEQASKMDAECGSPLVHFDARGKLKLYPVEDPAKLPEIVGELAAPGRTYLIKLASDAVHAELKPWNGREVTLMGKLRCEGKYFIVRGISGGGAPPKPKTNPRRM
jgi:hypothetical protein